jgi:hypothetical protein
LIDYFQEKASPKIYLHNNRSNKNQHTGTVTLGVLNEIAIRSNEAFLS